MRVLVACDWFLKYAAAQVVALQEAGVEAALLCRDHAFEFDGSTPERDRLLEDVERAGVRLFSVDGRVSCVGAASGAARAVGSVARWKPDVVHAHDNHDPRLLAVCRRYPLALTIHDPSPHPGGVPLGAGKRMVRSAWIRRADRIVVHGEALREELRGRVATRIAVIPHGAALRPAPLPRPEQRCVLFFGRLQRYKGLPVLLEAMETVWAARPDVRLLVLGDGPEAVRLPADERIERSIGYVPESEADAAFARASLVVLPYVQASQSGVGLLALARGIPTVVTDVGSLPDLALDSSFVVPPSDAGSLAATLLRHLDHGDDVRRATLERARGEFGWPVVARKSIALYDEMLGRRA